MQYIGLASSSASGKAGGLVASRGRIGTQFRARTIPRQNLTPSASEARAITGGLPALWRLLTTAEQATWEQLASSLPAIDSLGQVSTLTGYALYIACARRLITIGIEQQLTAAPAPPSIPTIYGFQAIPLYDNPFEPTQLLDLQLSTTIPLPPGFTPVLRASPALSPARANIRASNLRVIQGGTLWPSQPHSALALWLAQYGTAPPAGAITFELSLVDPLSGLVGAAVRAVAPYAYNLYNPPAPPLVTIQVEGSTIAEIPNTYIQVEGTTVAN